MNADRVAKLFVNIRADRLRRNGQPELSEERVIRSVIATQAMAGIDAKPHFGLPSYWKPGDKI